MNKLDNNNNIISKENLNISHVNSHCFFNMTILETYNF